MAPDSQPPATRRRRPGRVVASRYLQATKSTENASADATRPHAAGPATAPAQSVTTTTRPPLSSRPPPAVTLSISSHTQKHGPSGLLAGEPEKKPRPARQPLTRKQSFGEGQPFKPRASLTRRASATAAAIPTGENAMYRSATRLSVGMRRVPSPTPGVPPTMRASNPIPAAMARSAEGPRARQLPSAQIKAESSSANQQQLPCLLSQWLQTVYLHRQTAKSFDAKRHDAERQLAAAWKSLDALQTTVADMERDLTVCEQLYATQRDIDTTHHPLLDQVRSQLQRIQDQYHQLASALQVSANTLTTSDIDAGKPHELPQAICSSLAQIDAALQVPPSSNACSTLGHTVHTITRLTAILGSQMAELMDCITLVKSLAQLETMAQSLSISRPS
ncbi:hypothetical protein H4R34_005608 [Dimargaris verticillata]|uniref:Uncharacterized protein n=1 Tax=Dimargaris verticillata TaxID=2761393 RepID=A0A9W8AW77_9FUNG|nr:hypothetical protein H4R34_005608 [Dimargaris verticillata]